jgi:hypothetical protein
MRQKKFESRLLVHAVAAQPANEENDRHFPCGILGARNKRP